MHRIIQLFETMKRSALILLLALLPPVLSCSKGDGPDPFTSYDYESEPGHEMIVLGEKLEDPYSVTNVKKAISRLYPTKAGRVDVPATDIYVRFLPRDDAAFGKLRSMGVLLYDHPLDYRIVKEGDYYHDPELDDGTITWQYAVVPDGFEFPKGIEYEVIDECFISENSPQVKGGEGIDWKAVEREAFTLTGNADLLSPDTKAGERVAPSGRITIVDEQYAGGKPFGVAGVTVVCNVFVKIATAYTDRDGYYTMKTSFSANPRYRLLFKNEKNFSIGMNLILVPASTSSLGKGSPERMEVTVTGTSESKLFRRCAVNNAVYDYITRCREADMDITLPPRDLRIWIFNGMESSSSSMLHHGAVIDNKLWRDYLGVYAEIIKYFLPDITLGTGKESTYAEIYSVTVHELAHATHYAQAGNSYWDKFIHYIISSFVTSGGVTYGNGTGSDAGYCEVGEMWAYYLESKMYSERYGVAMPNFGTSFWFYPQIFRYLEERGLTRSQMSKALLSDVNSREKLKNKLIELYPEREAMIGSVFERYR